MWFELTAAAVVCLFGVWLGHSSEERRRRSGEQFARRNLALIDSEFVADFDRASARSRKVASLLWVGVFTALLFLGEVIPGSAPPEAAEAGLLGVAAAVWVSFRLYEAGREFPVPRGRPVTARSVRTVVSDYVSPQTRVLTATIAVLVAAFGVAVVQRWNDGELRGSDAVVLLAGVIATVSTAGLVEIFARAMCERPQRAVDACHLYFQDAWRGEALNQAHMAVAMCGFLVVMGAYGSDLVLDWSKPYPLTAAIVAGLALLSVAASQRRFRRRLWSGLAPGQVLQPGEPAPARVGASA